MMKRRALILAAALVAWLACADEARAGSRSYVSVTGSDANSCTFGAPCRTFAGALPKTYTGGEITALDSGPYGVVQIDRAMTLQAAPGVYAVLGDDLRATSPAASGVTPVIVDVPPDARVVLRNLHITSRPLPQAARGIHFASGDALHVENCVIAGFKEHGIYFNNGFGCSGNCYKLFVKDTFLRGNAVGVGAQGSAVVILEHSRIEDNATGVQVNNGAKVTLRDSVVAGNGEGIIVDYLAVARLESCAVTDNGTGLKALPGSPQPGRIYVSDTLVSGNYHGLVKVQQSGVPEAKIYSFGNNRLYGNVLGDAFDAGVQQQ